MKVADHALGVAEPLLTTGIAVRSAAFDILGATTKRSIIIIITVAEEHDRVVECHRACTCVRVRVCVCVCVLCCVVCAPCVCVGVVGGGGEYLTLCLGCAA